MERVEDRIEESMEMDDDSNIPLLPQLNSSSAIIVQETGDIRHVNDSRSTR